MAPLLVLPLVVILYVLMVRPQQRRIRAQQALVAAVQVGDEVITTAGLFGTITKLDGDVAMLEIADGVEVRIARAAIGRRAGDLGGPATVEPEAASGAPEGWTEDDLPGHDPHPPAGEGPAVGGAA